MLKAYALAMLAPVLWGCAIPGTAWKGRVEWPDDDSRRNIVPFTEAGTAIAAAAAVREMVRKNPYPDLFWGCSSPEQGLDVAVFKGPTPDLYYVLVDQRFDRCGGPRGRVLDGWYEYAVTPRCEVVAEAPPPAAEDDFFSPAPPSSPPAQPERTPPPAATTPSPTPVPAPAPEVTPSAEPTLAPPPPVPPEPGTQEPTPTPPECP